MDNREEAVQPQEKIPFIAGQPVAHGRMLSNRSISNDHDFWLSLNEVCLQFCSFGIGGKKLLQPAFVGQAASKKRGF
jgi:hypothetical protein